jgi:hypothetical protein
LEARAFFFPAEEEEEAGDGEEEIFFRAGAIAAIQISVSILLQEAERSDRIRTSLS